MAPTPEPNSLVMWISGLGLLAFKILLHVQADGLDEIVECLNDGGISTIEGGDLFFWDRFVSAKGCRMPAVGGA
jgi:hypothetical protein